MSASTRKKQRPLHANCARSQGGCTVDLRAVVHAALRNHTWKLGSRSDERRRLEGNAPEARAGDVIRHLFSGDRPGFEWLPGWRSLRGRRLMSASERENPFAMARVIESVPIDRHAVALTFDDGPGEWTPQILDLLRAVGVRATFFVIGESIAGREEILERTSAEGHEIGNHGYRHRNFDAERVPMTDVSEELARTSAEVERVVGTPPKIFRPPQGGYNDDVRVAAAACGFDFLVNVSVWTEDWNCTSPEPVIEGILSHSHLRGGAIIGLHDGRPLREAHAWPDCRATVEAVKVIVPALLAEGFELVTVSEMLAEV